MPKVVKLTDEAWYRPTDCDGDGIGIQDGFGGVDMERQMTITMVMRSESMAVKHVESEAVTAIIK